MKSILRSVHRWIGLTVGVVLVLICLSGTSLLFQQQVFRWAHGELIPAGMSRDVGSIDAWVKNAEAAVPGLAGPFWIWAPRTSHNISDAGMLLYEGAEPGGFGKTGYVAVLVAPASGEVLGVLNVDQSPAYAPIFLHGNLWSGPIGEQIVAVVAAGTVLLLALGLYLWWPSRQRLGEKLSPRPLRETLRNAARLHDWTGACALTFLLIVAVTGVHMASDWLDPALDLLPGSNAPAEQAACAGPIGFDQAIQQARQRAPGALTALIAEDHDDPRQRRWELVFKPANATSAMRETHLIADLGCGTVAVESVPGARAPRDMAAMVLTGLHDGTLLGVPGELFVSLLGLIPLVLAWSGIRRWLRRRAVAGVTRREKAAPSAERTV